MDGALPDVRTFTDEEVQSGQMDGGRASGQVAQGVEQEVVGVGQGDASWSRWTDEEWQRWNEGWWSWDQSAIAGRESAGDSWDPWRQWQGNHGDQRSPGWWDRAATKGDYSDPPPWSGWAHYRLWKRALTRWDTNTDVLLRRRSEKILKTFDYDLQAKLDHLSDQALQSQGYLQSIFEVLDVLAGEKEASEKRRAVRAALYEGPRKPEETLAQYSLRRDAQFSTASQYISIPDDLKAFMMEEQAGLSRQNLQNLRVLTGGVTDFRQVIRALQILDTEDEPIMKGKNSSYYDHAAEDAGSASCGDTLSDEEFELSEVEKQAFLSSISGEDLEEEAALSYLTKWESKKKRTWSENKALKNARRKDRRHFDEPSSRPPRPQAHRGKLPISELKKITRCGNCGQKGHWREDCQNPYKPKNDTKGFNKNAFVFLGTSARSSSSWCNFLSYLSIPAGCAIVDPGASQDLIGKKAFQKLSSELSKKGFKPVILPEAPSPAAGIGGQAKPLFSALAPCFLGKYPGVIKLTVIEEDIPHLLSIGLLEHAKAIIDTEANTIHFKAFDETAQMSRLESGHRLLDVVSGAKPFEIPPQVLEEYGLRPQDFRSDTFLSGGAYMAASSQGFSLKDRIICKTPECLVILAGKHNTIHEFSSEWVWISGGILKPEPTKILWVDEPNSERVEKFLRDFGTAKATGKVRFEHLSHERPLPDHEHVGSSCTEKAAGKTRLEHSTHDSSHEHVSFPTCLLILSHVPLHLMSSDSWKHVLQCVLFKFQQCFDEFGRLLDSCDMLRVLTTCFLNSKSLESHASHHGPTGSRQEAQERAGERAPAVPVVFDGVTSPDSHQGAVQFEVASHQCSDGMCTSKGTSCQRGQPIWPVGDVHLVPAETELRPILRREPQDTIEVSQGHHSGPASGGQDPEGRGLHGQGDGGPSSGRVCDTAGGAGHDATAAAGTIGVAGSNESFDEDSGHVLRGASYDDAGSGISDGPPSPDAGGTLSSGPGPGRRGDGQPKRFGSRASIAMSLLTLASLLPVDAAADPSLRTLPAEMSDMRAWYVLPFCKAVKCDSFAKSRISYFWQPEGSVDVFGVWHSPHWLTDFLRASDLDDREFQVPRHVKKDLSFSVQELLNFTSEASNRIDPNILLGLHDLVAEETQGLQEQDNNAGETPVLQEQDNNAVKTPGLQEKINSAGETPVLQEARSPTVGSQNCSEVFQQLFGGSFYPCFLQGPGTGLPPDASCAEAMPKTGREIEKGKYKVCELFSLPRLSALGAQDVQFTDPPNFDKRTGWDFFNASDRAFFWKCLRTQEPDLVIMSPECRPFSILMHSNWKRMSPKEVERIRTEGLAMLQFCIQVAEFQLAHNRSFLIEQPATASSLSTHSVKWLLDQAGVWLLRMEQCAAGLSVVDGKLSKKPTAMITNHLGMVYHLARLLCDGSHTHQQLQGGLPAKAQEFPEGLVKALLEGIRWAREHDFHGFNGTTSLEDEEEQLGEEEGEAAELGSAFPTPAPQTPSPARATRCRVTNNQKDLVYKLHVNTGHLPVPQMLAMLKAAGARDEIREYVKNEFHCLQCMKQHRPVSHRRSTFPKSFSFNKLVGIDFFYISFLGKTHAFLNVICLGTNLQQVALLPNYGGGPPNARDAWNLFSRLWLQPFGLPETLICDQGSEFKGFFERSLEQVGVFQAVIDGAAPWQNGKTERHGAWIKARLEDEIQSGQTIVQSSQELELLAQLVTCHKNRWFHRGGFSPYQLVFGVNPRIPLELLSDDQMVVPGIADAAVDPFEADGPAAEFARAHQIRQKARELCIASNLKDKVRLSLSHQLHQQKQWSPGQWVYVWRKFPGTGGGHTTRSRWVGPGLVILQQSGSVWVSMRARIWKCSSDQLRSASHLETLGAELSKSEGLSDILSQTRSKWMSRPRALQIQKLGTNQPSHDMSPAQLLPHHNLQIHLHPLLFHQYPRHSPHTLPATDLSGKSYHNHLKLQPPIRQHSTYLGRYLR